MLGLKKYVLALLLLNFTTGVFSQQLVVNNPLRFLALGDSYTIGEGVSAADCWPNQFMKALKNRGIETEKLSIIAETGWRTDNLLDNIEAENPNSNYNLVSLLIGVNNQFQQVDIDVYSLEFRQLLEKTISLCGGQKSGVFVLSIPDYGYTPFGFSNKEIISAEIDQYNQINKTISSEMGVSYFDITSISREVINKPEYLAPDNLHPSREMYAKWVELIINGSNLNINTTNAFEKNHSEKMEVYPNPASSSITFNTLLNGNTIVIYNNLGSVVWQSEIIPLKNFSINVSGWRTGIYYYQIKKNYKALTSGKFVVE